MKKTALASLLAIAAGGASAQAYVGAGAGWASIPTDCPSYATCKDSDVGFKVYGGYAFNPMVAAELGYINFGKATIDYSWAHGEVKANATTFALALRGQLGHALTGVARLGAASSSVKETSNFGYSDSGTSTNFYFGLGLEYAITKQVQGTVMLDATQGQTSADSGSLRLISAGIQAQF